jgi:hypothetical protein
MPGPEEKLLLALCRLDFTGEEKRELRSLVEQVNDWDKFVKISNEHGIIALSAFNLKETHLDNLVPEKQMRMLNDGLMQSMIRNTWLLERWKEVNRILTEAGIKHVLLKGMALEHTVYGSGGLRQMTDNDILVKRADGLKAWNLLQNYGFEPVNIKSFLHKKIIADIGKHLPTLVRDGYALEIHTRLFSDNEKNSNHDKAIDESVGIEIGNEKAFILNKELHLDYLTRHNIDHLSGSDPELRLFLDISILKEDNYRSINEAVFSDLSGFRNTDYRQKAYRQQLKSLPFLSGLRFLAGDIFPSMCWMKELYHCGSLKALVFFPGWLGKLLWLIKRGWGEREKR